MGERAWDVLQDLDPGRGRIRHVHDSPGRPGRRGEWPAWSHPDLVAAWREAGIDTPWRHQEDAADLAHRGTPVVVATGTGSGKSLAYQLPVLTAVLRGQEARGGRGATALYLAPTKALAADQAAGLARLGAAAGRYAVVDGDTDPEQRRWARDHAALVLTNPDLLHHHLLPAHERWAPFLRRLRFVVVDECHHYRGVFGAHVAAVLRRLRRLADHHGAQPVMIGASATGADPAGTLTRLTGVDAVAVTRDDSPRGRTRVVLWDPRGDAGRAGGRSAVDETARLLAEFAAAGARSLAFVGSRQGSEAVAGKARDHLRTRSGSRCAPASGQRVGPEHVSGYRGGYLPEDRRALESALRSGDLLGVATTSALELGIDIAGLDAVVLCGWPGRLSSLWQRVGRAGRAGGDAVAVLVAREDPLDAYLLAHPDAVFDQPMDATVLDPDNPYVLAPHLCAAASELPLRPADLSWFGSSARPVVDALVDRGTLRRRSTGWYWTHPWRAGDLADLRGIGVQPVQVVESATGRVLGTVEGSAADHALHPGAVHLHQGRDYVVADLDPAAGVALVRPGDGTVTTQAHDVGDLRILQVDRRRDAGVLGVALGTVEVVSQVVSYDTRDATTGAVLARTPLDLPVRTLRTRAVWWTLPAAELIAAGVDERSLAGAAHAAEHAAIALLPLVADCDRWDVGGVSSAHHPDTGAVTVVVHDAHPGGAGFAERAFAVLPRWLAATRDTVRECRCRDGCPACVQSPKCGNGNRPLDRRGALALLDLALDEWSVHSAGGR